MAGTVLEKYVGFAFAYDELIDFLIVFDVDIFSSHRGDASQSENMQMERCLIFCMVKQVENN